MSEIGFRYIVADVDAALPFYRDLLGFKVDMHPAPGFASLSKDGVTLYLNAPGAGGAGQDLGEAGKPAPGGWNRIQIKVGDAAAMARRLREAGYRLRGDVIHGQGGTQVLAEDPSGNPIELFQPK
jgi:catechol 2,3-dioxygenase-like lactoylglutathione lyase family enzyme